MTEDIIVLLTAWDVPPNVVENFKNNAIDNTKLKLIWLKHNTEPWDLFIKKWNSTYDLRIKQNFNYTVHDFLETWSILKESKGDTLILLDFESVYKEKLLNFYIKTGKSFSRSSIITNDHPRTLIESLGDIPDNDKKIPVHIYLLGYLKRAKIKKRPC